MAEINVVCAPVVVYLEDETVNPVSAQRKRENLQNASLEPLLPKVGYTDTQVPKDRRSKKHSISKQAGQLVSTLQDRQEKLSRFGRRGSQQESHPPPQPGQTRSNVPSEKHVGGVPRLLELYQFPGFSEDGPTPLPHQTSFSTVVTHVVRAQPRLNRKPRYKAVFQSLLSSVLMEHFVTDVFWWLFLQSFQPDGHVQDCLFSRIAENYIRILTHNSSSRFGNAFLRELPCTLSQTLYSSFCCCFPQSCSTIRNSTFLQTLCFIAYQWTGGLCPAPNVFRKWDFKALEPDEASSIEFAAETEKKETEFSLSLLDGMFPGASVSAQRDGPPPTASRRPMSPVTEPSHTSLKGTLSDSREQPISNSSEREEKRSSSEDIKGPDQKAAINYSNRKSAKEAGWYELEFQHCVFNVGGNSPLVQYYIRKFDIESRVGDNVLVRRTQIHRPTPADAVTLRQLLHQSRERSVAHWRDFRAMRAQCERDLAALQRSKAEHRNFLLKKQKMILKRRSSVKRFCQKLYPDAT